MISKFELDRFFDICPRLASCHRQTYGVPPSANEFCLLWDVDWQSCGALIYIN